MFAAGVGHRYTVQRRRAELCTEHLGVRDRQRPEQDRYSKGEESGQGRKRIAVSSLEPSPRSNEGLVQ